MNERAWKSDFAPIDRTTDEDIARQIAQDADTYPELTDQDLQGAAWLVGDRQVVETEGRAALRRSGGRPKSAHPEQHVSLRLDADVVDRYRATGAGWQSRINAVLRAELERTGTR